MRIIAGKFKGRRLKTPKTSAIRPTIDRVKESVFRILQNQITHAKFLDLCAGSGSIGLEAISRGAESVTFVDRHSDAIQLIRCNLHLCGLDTKIHQIQLRKSSVQKAIKVLGNKSESYDLIYFDPPYDSRIYEGSLRLISGNQLLSRSGLICVECSQTNKKIVEVLQLGVGDLRPYNQKCYGDTMLFFYKLEDKS